MVNTQQTVECNNFDQNRSGVYLFNANIGDQLVVNGVNTDQKNAWTPSGGTGASRGIVAVGSTPIPAGTWYFNTGGGLASNQMTPAPAVSFVSPATLNTGCPTAPPRMAQSTIVDVINEQGHYDTLAAAELYWSKKQVYYLLSEDDSLMLQGTSYDTLISAWFTNAQAGSIGLLKTVADSMDLNTEYAIEINNSITPVNHAEENEKGVNSIYALTWAIDMFDLSIVQYETLYAIATENPLTGGSAVYSARVMLGLIIDDEDGGGNRVAQVVNVGKSVAVIDEKIKLYPNPATSETVYVNNLKTGDKGTMTIYAKIGFRVKTSLLTEGSNNIAIDLHALTPGIYMVETKVNGAIKDIRKLVVIK